MSRYAYDTTRRTLIVTWGTGLGDVATVVAELSSEIDDVRIQRLAQALTEFSATAWRTYTHPASAAESLKVNAEGWRRQEAREALSRAPDALINPNLPRAGMMIQPYVPTEEAAHGVGRALHAIADAALRDVIVSEVRSEIDALERAELGDLTGRARQAVLLSREGASPVQVEAADRLLWQNPLDAEALFTEVDPVAAGVAAAHWLQAAADVAAGQSGLDPTVVVMEADNIEALPHRTPTTVLEMMSAGPNPYATVTRLIRGAMAAAEGRVPDLDALLEQIDEIDDLTRELGSSSRANEALREEIRTTPLDPSRPARDLLEDLLLGIRGCWLLYQQCADTAGEENVGEAYEQSTAAFVEALRAEARSHRSRLL
ncbi:hypothetical protein [Actinomadura rubrisoli]|uniref:Uncharacterized protein n=1 Tax=Actinomadura rubrisoli TaxID=2530368 RepID=A0A4R5BF35_9ACTN|nr:hypothetical protein [Actinomadura rubrisoli]TDD83480.1 hypothetical protein E1298_21265 [Actinomadura rubrisoli]